MKRFSSSPETLGSLFYPPPQELKNQKSDFVYDREFQAMLDGIEEDDCTEESSLSSEKKRRLSFDQVKALEKIFEVENKLDPERKTKIAHELGLQPRQVAVWFQNRRARSKTKRLERDYDILKASYEDLKLNFEKLKTEKEGLAAELKEHKMKLRKEATEAGTNACKQNNAFHQKQEIIANPKNGKLLEETRGGGQLGFSDSNCSTSSSSAVLQYDCSASVKSSSEWIMNGYDQQFLGASPLFQVNVAPQQCCWLGTEQEAAAAATTTNIFSLDQAPTNLQWHY